MLVGNPAVALAAVVAGVVATIIMKVSRRRRVGGGSLYKYADFSTLRLLILDNKRKNTRVDISYYSQRTETDHDMPLCNFISNDLRDLKYCMRKENGKKFKFLVTFFYIHNFIIIIVSTGYISS